MLMKVERILIFASAVPHHVQNELKKKKKERKKYDVVYHVQHTSVLEKSHQLAIAKLTVCNSASRKLPFLQNVSTDFAPRPEVTLRVDGKLKSKNQLI